MRSINVRLDKLEKKLKGKIVDIKLPGKKHMSIKAEELLDVLTALLEGIRAGKEPQHYLIQAGLLEAELGQAKESGSMLDLLIVLYDSHKSIIEG